MQQIPNLLAIVALVATPTVESDKGWNNPSDLQERGIYRYHHHGIFKVYDAILLAPAEATPAAILNADCPYELQLCYLRPIKKTTIIKSANRMLEKNLSPDELAQIKQRASLLHDDYEDVQPGDKATFRFDPLTGTTLLLNDKIRIHIPGKDFAKYYLQIWLGTKPVSTDMREALLGR